MNPVSAKPHRSRSLILTVALGSLLAFSTHHVWSEPSSQPRSPIEDGAKLTKVAGGFSFTEGPAADAEGNVYFTDQPNDRILKWGIDGKISTFMEHCGRSNGLCF